ncbi:hypothetical protein [Shimia sp.]|uniref:hypothetical protein n=1 Tax=Shimia sp. TaxID=1954381 RepID=UPI00329A2D2F
MNRPAMYTRPNKPLSIPVKNRRDPAPFQPVELVQPVIVDAATECHTTPDSVARRMVEYLGPQGDYLTLEPSAGTGQLIRALLASGHSGNELTMVERHIGLCGHLYRYGPVINRCFLEYAAEVKGAAAFPRIIMNPPFRKVRAHVAAAESLLGRGGHAEPATLVALVPVTFKHDRAETLEELPPDTFPTARVFTKIIRIESA